MMDESNHLTPEDLISAIEARQETRFSADTRSRLVNLLKSQLDEQKRRIARVVCTWLRGPEYEYLAKSPPELQMRMHHMIEGA